MNTIGERLRAERNKIGLSQEKFAEFCGIKKLTQLNYESGKSSPSAEYLVKIAEIGADVNYILTGVRMLDLSGGQQIKANEPAKLKMDEGTMLKGGGGAVNESFSEEDIKLLRLIKALAPEQKNDTVKDLEKFVRWNQSVISHWSEMNQNGHRMAQAA